MKKLIFLFASLFIISTSFVSCRETGERNEDDVEELSEELEDGVDEVEDEF